MPLLTRSVGGANRAWRCRSDAGLKYRHIDAYGEVSGGVFYASSRSSARWEWLAILYGVLAAIAAFGIGNLVQANTMARAVQTGLAVPPWITGIMSMVLVGGVTLGGIRRIAVTAEMIVPTRAVLCGVADRPGARRYPRIFADAFAPVSATLARATRAQLWITRAPTVRLGLGAKSWLLSQNNLAQGSIHR